MQDALLLFVAVALLAGCGPPGGRVPDQEVQNRMRGRKESEFTLVIVDPQAGDDMMWSSSDPKDIRLAFEALAALRRTEASSLRTDRSAWIGLMSPVGGKSVFLALNPDTVEEDFGPALKKCVDSVKAKPKVPRSVVQSRYPDCPSM
jgi:hypothetical protein